MVGTIVGLALFVIPGVIFFVLFALVGPVIVQEHLSVMDAFRRTYRLSRTAWKMILLLVGLFVLGEQVVEEVAHEAFHESGLGVQLAVEWLIALVAGGAVGLIEVALATELIARNPRRQRGSG